MHDPTIITPRTNHVVRTVKEINTILGDRRNPEGLQAELWNRMRPTPNLPAAIAHIESRRRIPILHTESLPPNRFYYPQHAYTPKSSLPRRLRSLGSAAASFAWVFLYILVFTVSGGLIFFLEELYSSRALINQ